MALFERRETPPTYSDPKDYKPFLRRDFRRMFAYCERTEAFLGGEEAFEIDHFRTQQSFPALRCSYPNLYYCCRKCNLYKSSKWPSAGQIAAGLVFADACVEDPYVSHLLEGWDGSLVELTPCGKFTNAHVRLDRPDVCEWRRKRKQARKDLPMFRSLETSLVQALDYYGSDSTEIEQKIEAIRRFIDESQDRFRVS